MSWLSNLFSNKNIFGLSSEDKVFSKRKNVSFDYFIKGQNYFMNGETLEALSCFDKAVEYGFEDHFTSDVAELFDLRAICLQKLNYHYDAISDFDKSISYESNDCNKFFSRSVSKGAILDFMGEIKDLEKAIQLSKVDNALNREYNDVAQKQGYINGAADMFQMRLLRAKFHLSSEIRDIEQIENAKSSIDKEYWQKSYYDRREKKLSRILRRGKL